MFVDPFELIKKVEPGLMLSGVAGLSQKEKQFIFLIREEERFIKKVGKYPTIQIRLGRFEDFNKAVAAMVMVRFENIPEMTYDGWLNYHAPMSAGQIERLAEQDNLIFQFYNSTNCVRTLAVKNSLKSSLAELVEKAKKSSWSMAEFDEVKNYIYDNKSPDQLWNSLI